MGMNIKTSAEPGFLRAEASGDFTLPEAKRTFLELISAVRRHKAEKVLFDGREITGEPTTMQRFYYAEFAALTVAIHSEQIFALKFAYVLLEPVLDPERFGEDVAVNRGMDVKAFDNSDEALRWLLV